MTQAYTREDKYRAARREIAQRERVYPRLVASGKMSEASAKREIAVMKAIARDYAPDEKAARDLFD